MDNPFSQAPGEAAKLAQNVAGGVGKGLFDVAKNTTVGVFETAVGSPNSPFAQTTQDKKPEGPDARKLKEMQDARKTRARIEQLQSQLRQVTEKKHAREQQQYQIEQQKKMQEKQIDQEKSKNWFSEMIQRAQQQGTGEGDKRVGM